MTKILMSKLPIIQLIIFKNSDSKLLVRYKNKMKIYK